MVIALIIGVFIGTVIGFVFAVVVIVVGDVDKDDEIERWRRRALDAEALAGVSLGKKDRNW